MTTVLPEIPEFEFEVDFNLIATPFIKVISQSSGSLAALKFIFKLYSPSGIAIHEGSFGSPDAVNAWVNFTFPESLPSAMGSVEWGKYTIIGVVRNAGLQEATYTRTFTIVPPCGWKLGQNTNYGKGILAYTVRCDQGKVKVQDKSNYSYKGLAPVIDTLSLSFAPPPDSTGVTPAPTVVTGFSATTFTIPYNGKYFHSFLDTTTHYNIGGNVVVFIKYKDQKDFPVLCNVDLCGIACEVRNFERKVACGSNSSDREKLIRINTLLNLTILAKLQPGCEMDIDSILRDIIEIGNFDCKCFDNGTDGIGNALGDETGDSCPIPGTLTVS